MKNTLKILGVIVLVAVIGFSMAACPTGGGGGGGKSSGGSTADSITYTGVSPDGSSYSLKITENTGRAVYTPKKGDSYELTASGKKSTGIIVTFSVGVFTLEPSNSEITFTVSISGSNLTEVSGTITWTDNQTTNAPGKLNTVINMAGLPIIAPVTGAIPVSSFIYHPQYTLTATWTPALSGGKFTASTVYTAKVTLSAKPGYTLQGVPANFFTFEKATVTNAANSGVVTAVFPATESSPPTPSPSGGNLGNYGFAEGDSPEEYQRALWKLSPDLTTIAKTPGAKLVLVLQTDPSNSFIMLAWQGPANQIWFRGKNIIDPPIIGATGATWNSGTKTLTIPLSASSVEDYSSFIAQPQLNLIIQYGNASTINALGIVSANLYGP